LFKGVSLFYFIELALNFKLIYDKSYCNCSLKNWDARFEPEILWLGFAAANERTPTNNCLGELGTMTLSLTMFHSIKSLHWLDANSIGICGHS
jgi:hypothetical protein